MLCPHLKFTEIVRQTRLQTPLQQLTFTSGMKKKWLGTIQNFVSNSVFLLDLNDLVFGSK